MERALIREYEEIVEALLAGLSRENHAAAVEIAAAADEIRGFGHVKAKSAAAVRARWQELLARYRSGPLRAAA